MSYIPSSSTRITLATIGLLLFAVMVTVAALSA
jgi:hypothetical protein